MKILVAALLASAIVLVPFKASAWGQTGHRVTASIAEHYLSDAARKEIEALFPHASLAEISTYADEKRSEPTEYWKKTTFYWHFATVPDGKTYEKTGAPPEGDAYTALKAFTDTLKNPHASREDKQLALHFIVHIIGDLHQPLHVGNGTDAGGNKFKVEFFWQDSNLHRVWDTQMINNQELSYTEWTDWLLKKISDTDAATWSKATPLQWMQESVQIRQTIYPKEDKLSYSYQYQHLPTIKLRLQQGGVRTAAYLNQVFE